MQAIRFSLSAVEHAIRDVCSELDGGAAVSWREHSEDDLWRELVFCILGSRVKFEAVYAAVERMDDMSLFSHPRRNGQFDQYEQDTLTALSGGYPFYRLRANQIRRAAECLRRSGGSILQLLGSARDTRGARRLLATELAGLGPKQASLFLRNIGYAKRIAVLDVHVLTYMSWVGLADASLKSISTLGKYEVLEDSFIQHAYSFGCSPDQFDFAVWLVMKVAKEGSDGNRDSGIRRI